MRITTLRPDDGQSLRFTALTRQKRRRFWLSCSVIALCFLTHTSAFAAEHGKKSSSRAASDMIDLIGLPSQPIDAPKPSHQPHGSAAPASVRNADFTRPIKRDPAPKPAKSVAARPLPRPALVASPVTPVVAPPPPVAIKLRIPAAPVSVGLDFVASIAPVVAAHAPPAPAQPEIRAEAQNDTPSPQPKLAASPALHAPPVQLTAQVPAPTAPLPQKEVRAIVSQAVVAAAAPRPGIAVQDVPRSSHAAPRPLSETRLADPATTGSLPSVTIDYVVRSQSLDQVLREIGQMAGLNVIAGAGVRTVLRERRLQGTAEKVIDQLAREHGLFWFNDGLTIYVDPADDQKVRFFKVRGATPAQLSRAIEDAGLGKFRARIQLSGKDGLVRVTGSDVFTRTVEAALTSTEVESNTIHVIRFGQRGQ